MCVYSINIGRKDNSHTIINIEILVCMYVCMYVCKMNMWETHTGTPNVKLKCTLNSKKDKNEGNENKMHLQNSTK